MANQALNQELQTLVADFSERLTLTVRRAVLEQVVAAMGGNGVATRGPGRRGPGRPRGSTNAATRGGKRSAEQVDAMGEKLLAHVKSNPGQRADQIATTLRSDVKTIRLPMQRLLAMKKVKTKGQRRGTTYFAS
jgi:hypothetical protein